MTCHFKKLKPVRMTSSSSGRGKAGLLFLPPYPCLSEGTPMITYPSGMPTEFTSDPVEGEVSNALALYKIALINASYRNIWHRLACKLGIKESLANEQLLVTQELQCRKVVNQSAEHKAMVEYFLSMQPTDTRQRDNFIRLMNP